MRIYSDLQVFIRICTVARTGEDLQEPASTRKVPCIVAAHSFWIWKGAQGPAKVRIRHFNGGRERNLLAEKENRFSKPAPLTIPNWPFWGSTCVYVPPMCTPPALRESTWSECAPLGTWACGSRSRTQKTTFGTAWGTHTPNTVSRVRASASAFQAHCGQHNMWCDPLVGQDNSSKVRSECCPYTQYVVRPERKPPPSCSPARVALSFPLRILCQATKS